MLMQQTNNHHNYFREGLVLPLPLASDAEKKQLDVRNFGHTQPLTENKGIY